jgi:hypothetical protein
LLIGLLILGGFWLVSDSYWDGYSDGLLSSREGTVVRYRGGPHFPWGLVIVGGIAYIAWRKGAFDRFGGPGGPFNAGGGRGMQRYGDYRPGNGPAPTPGHSGSGQGFGPMFRGPRAFFDEWHRQAHEAERQQRQSQGYYRDYPEAPAPPAPASQPASPAAAAGNGASQAEVGPTPPPPPPAPDYWTAMAPSGRPAGTSEASTGGGTSAPPAQPQVSTETRAEEPPAGSIGGSGPVLERW